MKKLFFVMGLIIFLFSFSSLAEEPLKLLRIKDPPEAVKGKNTLLVNVKDAETIVGDFKLKEQEFSGFIELADMNSKPLAKLARVKKGELKWSHKIHDNQFLVVKFNKEDYPVMLEKIKGGVLKPGLRLQTSESKTTVTSSKIDSPFAELKYEKEKYILKWREITFVESPDLSALIKYPVKVEPGQELLDDITITVTNNGTTAARDFTVELVLSSDEKIPLKPAAQSKTFADDMLLSNGKKTVELLNPGESLSLKPGAAIRIPADAPPAKYYLGAVVDPENKIKEISKDNNTYAGFLMISMPAPKCVIVDMCDTRLTYEPTGFKLQVDCQGKLLSNGKDWRKCMIKPYIHQLKHLDWKNFFWEVNTLSQTVWKITGTPFCKTGGNARQIKAKVQVNGGSRTTPPTRFTILLADTRMELEPASRGFKIDAYDTPLAYLPLWHHCQVQPHLYHVKNALWPDSFWEVDCHKKQVNVIVGGKFCNPGGSATLLEIAVMVENR
jgi:hypothetical protein